MGFCLLRRNIFLNFIKLWKRKTAVNFYENDNNAEKALLVEVDTGEYDVQVSLAELYELTKSAGVEPFGAMTQKRPVIDKATCCLLYTSRCV